MTRFSSIRSPANHALHLWIGAGFHDRREFAHLFLRQEPGTARTGTVFQAIWPFVIEAMRLKTTTARIRSAARGWPGDGVKRSTGWSRLAADLRCLYAAITRQPKDYTGTESVRSRCDGDEEDDGNSAFCRAAPA